MEIPNGGLPYIDRAALEPYFREERRALRATASRLAFCAFAAFPLSQIASVFLGLLLGIVGGEGFVTGDALEPTFYYLFTALLSFVTILLPFLIFFFAGRYRLTDTILTEPVRFGDALPLVLGGLFLCFVMNIPSNFISELLEGVGLDGSVNTESMVVASPPDLVSMVLAVVLVSPVVEEICFRGIVVSALRRWGDGVAVVFSALLFAMAHFSIPALPVVLAGGLVMAFLYARTGNLWINIAIHLLNNLLATFPLVLGYFFGSEVEGTANDAAMLFVSVAGVASLVFLTLRQAICRRPPFPFMPYRGEYLPRKPLELFRNPGMICFILLFLVLSSLSLYGIL